MHPKAGHVFLNNGPGIQLFIQINDQYGCCADFQVSLAGSYLPGGILHNDSEFNKVTGGVLGWAVMFSVFILKLQGRMSE